MVYSGTMLSYPDWKLPFTVHTDASDNQFCSVISHNKKPLAFFSIMLSKPHRNYNTTEKELPTIV